MIRFRKPDSDISDRAILENLGALYGFAMSLTRNPVDAEDLVQETCLRAIKGVAQNGIKSDAKVWLFTILRNLWINQWRRRTKGPEFILLGKTRGDGAPLQEWLSDETHRPDDQFERNLVSGKIRTAISGLPEVFREVVVLRYFEGFSYRQIAAILGCPAGTVMSRLNRARAELRVVLDEKNTSLVFQRKRGNE
ncbi:MAG TPA: RNA polymerase sigma factor [Candidatus Binatia bacterium]|nr:RNA polymerase sigma factor [Candidatus Binatia bacterium]